MRSKSKNAAYRRGTRVGTVRRKGVKFCMDCGDPIGPTSKRCVICAGRHVRSKS